MISEESSDIVRRGKEIYELKLKASLEKTNLHDFLAIEPDSGDYFLGARMVEASMKARQAHPGKRCFLMRVGHKAAVHIGNVS